MALQLQGLLEKFGPIHCVLTFVKNDNNNLGSMVTILQSIIDCEPLMMSQVYEGTCFGHVMSKVCQYTTNLNKVSVGPTLVNVKHAYVGLQKTITWTKKLGKGRLERKKACMDSGL